MPREIEFTEYLTSLLKANQDFRNIGNEVQARDFDWDITAERKSGTGWRRLAIECKNYPAFSSSRLQSIVDQLSTYRDAMGSEQLVLAFPGRLSQEERERLASSGVEAWDIDFLADSFHDQIRQVAHPYFQTLLTAVMSQAKVTRFNTLIGQLKACRPGKVDWGRYQKLAAEILETLFCPPLNTPIAQSPDATGVNRRDVVLPNYAADGFWKFMRESYKADFLVVDAKNSLEVGKGDVLQVANYLKSHGAGLFALIMCRRGGDQGCVHTLREQWIAYNKLILLLNDQDVEAMLLAKSAGGQPEEVIRQKIEDFRLSL